MPCWCLGNCPHIGEPIEAMKAGRAGQAETLLRRNLSDAPLCVECNLMLASIMGGSNRAWSGELHLARARKIAGDDPRVMLERARNLRAQAKPRQAADAFADAIELQKDNPEAWGGKIGALEAAGELEAAADAFTAASSAFGGELPPAIRFEGATVCLARDDPAGAVALLDKDNATPIERLLRGRAKEALGDYAGAWSDWTEAKLELHNRQGHVYTREHFLQLFAGLYEISQPARFRMLVPCPELEIAPGPLFVTGFPRSGTTMLETALASHSRIIDGDEVMGIADVTHTLPRLARSSLPYPHCLMSTTLGDSATLLTMCRDLYWRNLQAKLGFNFGPADYPAGAIGQNWAAYVTDKMPLNETHLPLICLLFPRAPFIYCRRHPLDILVSTLSYHLPNGGHYAESIETTAEHLAGADALLQHYKATLPLDRFREIKYENLVNDFAGELESLLELCGLELEPACLEFHKNPRHSRTISYAQIHKPLYTSSVGRFKNFRPFLGPVMQWIEPILKREGYNA